GIAANFANHDNGVGFGVFVKHPERIGVGGANDGVAADADGGGLPDAAHGELVDGFVGESPRSGNNANVAFLVNVAGHDTNLAFTGRDDARAVGANEARLAVFEEFRGA